MKEPTEVLKNKMIEVQNVLGDAIKDLESMIAKPTPSGEMGKPRFNTPSDQNISDAAKIAKMPGGFPAHQIAWAFGVYKQLVAFMEQSDTAVNRQIGDLLRETITLEQNVEAKKGLIGELSEKLQRAWTDKSELTQKLESAKKNWEYFQKDRDLFHDKWVDEVEKQNPLKAQLEESQKRANKFDNMSTMFEEERDHANRELIKANESIKTLNRDRGELLADRSDSGERIAKQGTELKNLEACLKSAQDDRDEWKGSSLAYEKGEKSLKHEIDLASEKIKEFRKEVSRLDKVIIKQGALPCTDPSHQGDYKCAAERANKLAERLNAAEDHVKELKEGREHCDGTKRFTWQEDGKRWEFCVPRLVE